MSAFFADTSYYIALMVPNDVAHARAVAAIPASNDAIVTTEWVLSELASYFSTPPIRSQFVALVRRLKGSSNSVVVSADASSFSAAFELYSSRSDKSWSLVDCSSFLVMRELGIQDALTSDRHFEQAGFNVLLKS